MEWQTSRFRLDLSRPLVMGIVNVTPDSFSDGGRHASTAAAIKHAERLLKDGADLLDIGGESTRPGAPAVGLEEELARVLPVVCELVRWKVPISVDTYKPEVMRQVLAEGVDVINDIWALRQPEATQVVAQHPNCGVCLMHMHLDPQTMQTAPMTGDVVAQVRCFLEGAALQLQDQGVARERIMLDPGIGFGKTVAQNFALLARQESLLNLGWPVLAGWSRKSSLGVVTARDGMLAPPAQRVFASVTAAVLAAERGARVLRVHDVQETIQGLQVWQAMHAAAA